MKALPEDRAKDSLFRALGASAGLTRAGSRPPAPTASAFRPGLGLGAPGPPGLGRRAGRRGLGGSGLGRLLLRRFLGHAQGPKPHELGSLRLLELALAVHDIVLALPRLDEFFLGPTASL